MAPPWEELPFVGPVLGFAANALEDGSKEVVGAIGGVVNTGVDVLVGEERMKRIATGVPKWIVDNFGDENQVVDTARDIFRESGNNSLGGLIAEVLKRSPDLIDPRLLLESSKHLVDKISEKVNQQADSVRELTGQVFQASLDLLSPVLDVMDPTPLFESLLKTAKCLIGRISQVHTEAAHRLLGEDLEASLKLIIPALDLINPLWVLEAASKIIKGISLEIKRPVPRQVDEVIQDTLALINSAAPQVNPELLLTTLVELTRTVLTAILAKVGQLGIIQGGIFSNEINAATLGLVWSNRAEFAEFLIDVAECTKCYASAISLDGNDGQSSPHGRVNELDFSQSMNRHALTCQAQRLAKSVILILKEMATPTRFTDIRMTEQTTLQSDGIYGSGTVLKVRPSGWQRVVDPVSSPAEPWIRLPTSPAAESESRSTSEEPEDQPQSKPKVTNEKWLFVNGIATELFWLHLACEKLAKWSSREVTGVYNRGDGILWDLIECAGERDVNGKADAKSQKQFIQRTLSSKMAQESLKEQLKFALQAALEQAEDGDKYTHVIMIAHSQGCLILRLVLEDLLTTRTHRTDCIRKTMWNRLCVFTFGNPSVDWKLEMDSNSPIEPLDNNQKKLDLTYLSSHCLRTEHFANKADFVAKLGVLSEHKQTDSGYAEECVFVNRERDWVGHLFGTQYSLHSTHYKDEHGEDDGKVTGDNSWLLACGDGVPIEELSVRAVG